MQAREQYTSTIFRGEAAARKRGHALGAWQPVAQRLQASMCEVCGEIAWVTRFGEERRWRMGGTALEQDCLESKRR